MFSDKSWIVVQKITSFLVAPVFHFFFFSLSLSLFNLFTIYESSFHLGSAQINVRKYVGISNCLNIARASYKVCFQYCNLTLTDPIKENALLMASNMSVVTL